MEDNKKLILPFDDFEPEVEELEKACEEHQEEVKKTFEDELKLANEINGNEHTKAIPVEPKMPKNEKLILKEPDETLNENLTMSDRDNFNRDLFNAIAEVCFTYNYLDLTREDIEQALEWFELHFFDQFDEDDFFEENLDEALPRDLSKVYKGAQNVLGGTRSSSYGNIGNKNYKTTVDFNRSDYQEITPEEAKAQRKAGNAKNLRVIFDGQLITFNEKGEQRIGNYAASRSYNSDKAKYTKAKNGKIVDKTNGLSFDEVINGADKIYLTNEIPVDPAIRQARSTNPESPFYAGDKGSVDDLTGNDRTHIGRAYDDSYRSFNNYRYSYGTTENNIKDVTARINDSKNELNTWLKSRIKYEDAGDTANVAYCDEKINYYRRVLKGYEQDLKILKNKVQDKNARDRYLSSELALLEPFKKLKEYKDAVYYASRSLANAKRDYNDAKTNGSRDTQRYRNQLNSYNERLKEILRSIAEYELLVKDAEDAQGPELDRLLNEISSKQAELDSAKADLDKLLRRN